MQHQIQTTVRKIGKPSYTYKSKTRLWLTIVYIPLLTTCHQQTVTGCHGDTVVDRDLGHMACAELPRTDSRHLESREWATWIDSKFLSIHPSIFIIYPNPCLSITTSISIQSKAFLQLIFTKVSLCNSSPEACSLSCTTGNAAGGPAGPQAPGTATLSWTGKVGAGENSVCAAAVVAVDMVLTACSPALPQCINAVTLPQLYTHTILLQFTYIQTCIQMMKEITANTKD